MMVAIATYILLGLGATAVVTFGAFFIGAVVAVPLVFATRVRFSPLRILVRVYVDVVRSVPPLVWLFLIYFGLTQVGLRLSSLVAAVVAFGLIASSYLAEIYRGGLAGIGRGQWEASTAAGLGRADTARFVILPQMLRLVSPTMATYLIGLLKDSALASTIGVIELTYRANSEAQTTGKGLLTFTIVGVIYLLISLPLAFASRHVDSRARAKFSVA
jgi:polar amino acid transport system permease protein